MTTVAVCVVVCVPSVPGLADQLPHKTLNHPSHTLSITCGLCKHHSMLEVVDRILVVSPNTTAYDVRQKFCCQKCKVKGNNTYKIVWRGNSDMAINGAAIKPS